MLLHTINIFPLSGFTHSMSMVLPPNDYALVSQYHLPSPLNNLDVVLKETKNCPR
jgi:hypothetical protein